MPGAPSSVLLFLVASVSLLIPHAEFSGEPPDLPPRARSGRLLRAEVGEVDVYFREVVERRLFCMFIFFCFNIS